MRENSVKRNQELKSNRLTSLTEGSYEEEGNQRCRQKNRGEDQPRKKENNKITIIAWVKLAGLVMRVVFKRP